MNLRTLLCLIALPLLLCCRGELPVLRGEVDNLREQLAKTNRRVATLEQNEAESLKVLGCTMEDSRFLDFIRACSGTACTKEDINLKVNEIFRDNLLITHLSQLRHKVIYPFRRSDDLFDLSGPDQALLQELLDLPALPTRRFVVLANFAGTPGNLQADAQERGEIVQKYLQRPQTKGDRTVSQDRVRLVIHSFGLQRNERLSRADVRSVQPDLRRSVWVFYVLC